MNSFLKTLRELSPNCRAAVRLQSEALDHPLSRSQRIGLRIHLALCVWCMRYGKHLKILRDTARQCEPDSEPERALSPQAKERIKRALVTGRK